MKKKENKLSWQALLATFLFSILTFLLLWFLGLSRPFPPPPEYGFEVSLGDSMEGSGDFQPENEMESVSESNPIPAPEEVEEEILSQEAEESVALPVPAPQPEKKPRKPQPEKKPQPQPKEEVKPQPEEVKINEKALFPGKSKRTSENTTASQGTSDVAEGKQGRPEGDPDILGSLGQGGGGGIAFSLQGRTLSNLVKPKYNSQEQGIVVVKIWVDKQGRVVRTQVGVKGTTTSDLNLWKLAETAAANSSFEPKESAPEMQVGTISYKFVRGN